MQTLEEKFNSSLDLIRLEIRESKPLPKHYTQALQHIVGKDFEPRELFYNNTCLVTTDFDDAKFLESRLPECKIMLKLESEYFGIAYYFINFIDNKTIMALIGGIT